MLNLLRPFAIEHFQVFFYNSYFFLLMCLIEILKNNCDVHVNHYHEVDDDERHKIDNGYKREATVAFGSKPI